MILLCRVSTHCNLSCPFCAYDRRLQLTRTQLGDAQVARLIALLADWHQRRPGSLQAPLISWLGGEPLLWSSWERYSRLARRSGLRVSATSNGTQLVRAAVRVAVLECLDELTISVDAPGAAHDQLRGWPGGYVRVRKAIAALAHLRAEQGATLRLRVNVVLMRQTIDQFPQLAAELAELGIDEISCNLLGGRDRPEFYAQHAVPAPRLAAFVDALPALRASLANHGVQLVGDSSYWQRLMHAAAGVAQPVDDCAPGTEFVFCDEYARLSPCAFTSDELGVPLDSLTTLDELPLRYRQARARACPAACHDCPSTQVFGKFAADVDLRYRALRAVPEWVSA